MYDINVAVPDITSDVYTNDNKFRLIKNYLYELNDALSCALSEKQMGETTYNPTAVNNGKSKVEAAVQRLSAQSIKRFNELKENIIRTADDIRTEYTVLVEERENELIQSVQRDYVAGSEFGEYCNEASAKIEQNADAIRMTAENVDAVSNSLDVFKETTRSEINLRSDAVVSQVERIYATKEQTAELEERISSEVNQSVSDITESFSRSISEIGEDISSVGGDFAEFVSDLNVYIRRGELEENVYGIEIGRSDSNIKARFTNDRLSFYQGNTEVAYVSGSSLYITNAHIIDYLKIGNSSEGFFMLDMTKNGLEVRWINGD